MESSAARQRIRNGEWKGPTSGLALGYAQANIVLLDKRFASDFRKFCEMNPEPCPLLEEVPTGCISPSIASNSNITTDVPLYHIYEHGERVKEVECVKEYFTKDTVSFLLGCSFSFEQALMAEGIPLRNIEQNKNVAMYRTNRECISIGPFHSPLVVSMRPIPRHLVEKCVEITSKLKQAHGGPIHIGDPEAIGIKNLNKPDYGDAVEVREDEIPLFWACGVTSTLAAVHANIERIITHAPGHMFITDLEIG